jgi:RNA polymerase sigma-70 factor, ECF subfamily
MSNLLGRQAAPADIGQTFDDVVLPHLDAARRLARWLTGNNDDADDVVQEASLRAFRYFRTFSGGNGRAWFLSIVRHTCWRWRRRGFQTETEPFDEERHSSVREALDPEALLLQIDDMTLIDRALNRLPARFRELLVLRELEGLSYQELAETLGVPPGTVMSGLSRARRAFHDAVMSALNQSGVSDAPNPRERPQEVLV